MIPVRKFSLGFSPCPNDTFIFDALVNKKIETDGYVFEPVIEDIEKLNNRAFGRELDVTKLSFFAFAHVAGDYRLLDAGSALGKNCGPVLVSKNYYPISEIENLTVAIPGKYTTANCLLNMAFPGITSKKEMLFSDIENAVLKGITDAGVLIHESRFTYESKGLKKITDLGECWETSTGLALPLGGIAVKKSIDLTVKHKINTLIRQSISYAFANPGSSASFIKMHSQELSDEVIRNHISLYVNNFSLNMGKEGKSAVLRFFENSFAQGLSPKLEPDVFLTNYS